MKWSENLDRFTELLGPVCIANANSNIDFDDAHRIAEYPNELKGLDVVTIKYIKEDPDHTINSIRHMIPIHMFETQAGDWCFKAYCLRDRHPKYFRFDRINKVRVNKSWEISWKLKAWDEDQLYNTR